MRAEPGNVVYGPDFERTLEQPIASSIAVEPRTRLVIIDGNYLLSDVDSWPLVRGELTEIWYGQATDELRPERLVNGHIQFGKTN